MDHPETDTETETDTDTDPDTDPRGASMTAARWDGRFLAATVAITSLRNRIRTNAAFCFGTGVFTGVAAGWLGGLLGSGRDGVVRVAGAGLVAYAVGLLLVASARWRRLRTLSPWIVAADGAWVLGTAVVLAAGGVGGAGGRLLVGSVGCVVGAVALAQVQALRGARRLEDSLCPDIDLAPPVEAIRVERVTGLDSARLWGSVQDHALFGRLARNLDRVEVLGGEGLELTRRCVANNGSSWVEQCTVWEPGRCHAVEVDTSDYPYPLQLVACLCYLEAQPEPESGRHRVGLVFQLRAEPGLWGQLFVLGVHLRRSILARIVAGWIAFAGTEEAVTV